MSYFTFKDMRLLMHVWFICVSCKSWQINECKDCTVTPLLNFKNRTLPGNRTLNIFLEMYIYLLVFLIKANLFFSTDT